MKTYAILLESSGARGTARPPRFQAGGEADASTRGSVDLFGVDPAAPDFRHPHRHAGVGLTFDAMAASFSSGTCIGGGALAGNRGVRRNVWIITHCDDPGAFQ